MGDGDMRVEEMPVFGRFYQLALVVELGTRAYPADYRWLRSQTLRSSESKVIASIERKVREYGQAKPNAVREAPVEYSPSTINH